MSALRPKADIVQHGGNVRFGPKAYTRRYSMNSAAGWELRRRTVIAAAVEGSIGSAPINVTLADSKAAVVSSGEGSSLPDCLWSLALLRHACHVTVRFKRDVMRALFQGRHAAFVEDHLFADVVIALRILFQLFSDRMYDRYRARCVVVAPCWVLSFQRPTNRHRKNSG